MCLSAETSFVAGGALLVCGIDAVRHSNRVSSLPLAFFPLIFSIQQISEGVVWLGLNGHAPGVWYAAAIRFYVIMACVVWPVLIPLALLMAEPENTRRRLRQALVGIGMITGLYYLSLLLFNPLSASISTYHVSYHLSASKGALLIGLATYIVATGIPFLLSRLAILRYIGFLWFPAFLIPAVFFRETFISIWCFFAALMSLLVCRAMRDLKSI